MGGDSRKWDVRPKNRGACYPPSRVLKPSYTTLQVQEETDVPTISVAARFRYSEVRSAEIEYSAGGGNFLHVCAHASSKAPSRQPLPYEPCPDQTRQQRPNKCLRPVPAPLAPSLARPSRSAPSHFSCDVEGANDVNSKKLRYIMSCARTRAHFFGVWSPQIQIFQAAVTPQSRYSRGWSNIR